MKQRLFIGLALAVLIGWCGWWWSEHFEYVADPPRADERGPARYNAFYALERALNGMGFRATSIATLAGAPVLPPDGTVVLYAEPSTIGPADAARLLAFVNQGGHLIIDVPNPLAVRGPLLEQFGLAPAAHQQSSFYPEGCAVPDGFPGPRPPDAAAPAIEPCFSAWLAQRFHVALANPAQGWIGRLHVGAGSVSVADLAQLVGNRALRLDQHDGFVWWLLAPNLASEPGPVLLIYALDSRSIWALLFEHGWQALLALGLLGGALLWRSAARFGPLLPSPVAPRRALLEHVRATAQLAWRNGDRGALYDAARDLALARIRLPRSALDEQTIANLALRSGFDADTVRATLKRDAPREPNAFTRCIAVLLTLRRST